MAKDLICGMDVDEKTALRSEYKGQTYYFCSPACKQAFDRNPAPWVSLGQTKGPIPPAAGQKP